MVKKADNHCHILNQYFKNPIEELNNLKNTTELEYVSSMALDYETSLETLELKKKFDDSFLKIGCGLHPMEVISLGAESTDQCEKIMKLIESNLDIVDYVGEIGMDFTYPNSRVMEKYQVDIFTNFCKLALKLKKPVSIHARESWKEIMEVVNELYPIGSSNNGYLHSFTGNLEQGKFFIERGFKLGLNGIITFNKSNELRETVKQILELYSDKDFNDLFGLETDSPYLSPEPIRKETNTPRNINYITKYITEKFLN